MPSSATPHKLSECLGLSEYEAKVYISLIERGAARARTLSTMSGVPRTKVYSVLKKLIDMGLVVEVPEEPRRFAPLPPKIAFEPYIHSFQGMVDNLLSVVSFLEETLEKAEEKGGPRQIPTWVISGRQEILKKIRKMLAKARRSVHLITNENGMVLLYKSFNKLLDDLAERSVNIRIVTSTNSNNHHVLNQLRYTCQIQEGNFRLPLILLSVDEECFLLARLEPDDFSLESEDDNAVFSDDPVLLEIVNLLVSRRDADHPFPPLDKQIERTVG